MNSMDNSFAQYDQEQSQGPVGPVELADGEDEEKALADIEKYLNAAE